MLTELGAHETIIAEALRARPDLTPEQIAATWAWHQWRRERSGGRLGEGVFFHAIRRGQIHAAPQSEGSGGVIDVDAYTSGAYGDLFRRGGDVSDLQGWAAPLPQPRIPVQPLGGR